MFMEFNVASVSADLATRSVVVAFTKDVDEDSTSLDTLVLFEKESMRTIPYTLDVVRNTLTLKLADWPVPNSAYIVEVRKGIESIVGDKTDRTLRRTIVFKSSVTSEVNITSPAMYEEIDHVDISWAVSESKGDTPTDYRVQLSPDSAFYLIEKETVINGKEHARLMNIKEGQYFLRVRAEKDAMYGEWSEVITFLYRTSGANKEDDVDEPEEDDLTPVFEDGLEIVQSPSNGETPERFVFKFNKDIHPDLVRVSVKKRKI